MSKFDSIKVGDKAEISYKITKADVEMFVELTSDDNKLHVDAEYASKTTFKKPVAHGMLGASFISTIIGTKLPGDGALWYAQNLEFLRPAESETIFELKRRFSARKSVLRRWNSEPKSSIRIVRK